jgi:cytochrome c553
MKFIRLLTASSCLMAMSFSATAADSALGESLSNAQCVACHGQAGNSQAPAFPKLNGQSQKYLIDQLKAMKSGARQAPQMAGIVQNLSDTDMANLAAYFSSQEAPKPQAISKEFVDLGEKRYRSGNLETGLTACAACHGATGKGMPEAGFPALSGQHADYIKTQLKAYRAAGRKDKDATYRNHPMMQNIAAKLSDDEIEALSQYISSIH